MHARFKDLLELDVLSRLVEPLVFSFLPSRLTTNMIPSCRNLLIDLRSDEEGRAVFKHMDE